MSSVKLYSDEHVRKHITNWLRKSGIDIISTEDANNKGKSDIEQLKFAASQKRVILTADAGFLQSERSFGHSGIFLIAGRKTDKEVVAKITGCWK